jgi:hypothetical protein
VRLPELVIKKFDGDLTKWATFWDTFESSVHNNTALSPVEKFSYLISLLESSAASAIAGLALTAVNYDEVVATLRKRYGNKQLIVSRHMEVLMGLKAVSSANDIRRLRRLYDTIETQVRGLNSLGVSPVSYGELLSTVTLGKLPSEIRLIVTRGLEEDNWNLERILELFETELVAREVTNAGYRLRRKLLPDGLHPLYLSFPLPHP